MIYTLYVEEAVADHPRVEAIRDRLPQAGEIRCQRYGEVFNPRAQSFRLQKERPALILAEKHDSLVRLAPADYGIGGDHDYVFSPLLNCLYDCRYCFLRGQHASAHYLLFVNFEDYAQAVAEQAAAHPGESVYFFCGFDSDSLALEAITGFCDFFLPALAGVENAWLELRSKSHRVEALLACEPQPQVVVAFTFTPEPVAAALERRAPSNDQRLRALAELAEGGWPIGLRFDPLIYFEGFEEGYGDLFAQIFEPLDPARLHSVTLGPLRFPKAVFARAAKLYPDDPFLAGPLVAQGDLVSYPDAIAQRLTEGCRDALTRWVPEEKIFCSGPK